MSAPRDHHGLRDARTMQTYARAGFGAAVRRGERPAIVVDLTSGFTDPAAPTGSDLGAVVTATGELIQPAVAR